MKTTNERIASMETCIKEVIPRIEKRMDSIDVKLNNHIVHISAKIDTIEEALNKRPSWFMTLIIGLLLALLGIVLGFIIPGA